MKMYDITGTIKNGMWNYDLPFPTFDLKPMENVPWTANRVYCEKLEGMHSQTGTYIETPAHFYGNENSYLIHDVPLEKLINTRCILLMLDENDYSINGKRIAITAQMLENCEGSRLVEESCAILVGTGWGKHWMDNNYLKQSPFFITDAIEWLISKRPIILGTDFPRWDNIDDPQGFFPLFYEANILMLAPCINLENVNELKFKLTVLPLKIEGTSCVPCRAILTTEGCD